jgi:hypothetical protein
MEYGVALMYFIKAHSPGGSCDTKLPAHQLDLLQKKEQPVSSEGWNVICQQAFKHSVQREGWNMNALDVFHHGALTG